MIALTIFEADAFVFLAELVAKLYAYVPFDNYICLLLYTKDSQTAMPAVNFFFKEDDKPTFQYMEIVKASCINNIGYEKFANIIRSQEFRNILLCCIAVCLTKSPTREILVLKTNLQNRFFSNKYLQFEGLAEHCV